MLRWLRAIRRYAPRIGEPAAAGVPQTATCGIAIVTVSCPGATTTTNVTATCGIAIVTVSCPGATTPAAPQTATCGIAIVLCEVLPVTVTTGDPCLRVSICRPSDTAYSTASGQTVVPSGANCDVVNSCPTDDYGYVSKQT
mgnify:CR=1 FL=1